MIKKLLTSKTIFIPVSVSIFILAFVFMPLVLFFLSPGFCSQAESPGGHGSSMDRGNGGSDESNEYGKSYQHEKKAGEDQARERQQVISKLREDKQKCDLAIENTKLLIDRSKNKPYLPEMYLRLAELYIEKSRLVYFLRKAESSGTSVKSLEQLESNALKNQAIELYLRILTNFPDFKDLDKVHFYLAHEYRELGQIDAMITQYRAIISAFKDSPYAAESYLLLGDYFFNAQDLDMAQRHYEAVLNYPQSSGLAIARYKLAWCYINRANFQEAIKLFEESVTSLTDAGELDIDTYKRVDVRIEALTDMAYCYGECYKESTPSEAIAYFEKYAWARPVYTLALEKLANRYLIKNKWSHAAAIYRKLSTLRHDTEKLLEYSRRIFECVRSMEHFEDADQDVGIMIAALRKQKYSVHIPEEEKKKNLADFELYARDMITRLHQKAREKKSKEDFIRAADSYKAYLEFFDSSPTYREMEANYAEALFAAQRYLDAGKQYEKRARAIPQKNRQREESLYSAVLSYYSALKQSKDSLTPYQIASARGGLKTCGKAYTDDFPASPRVSNVLFNVAWITYDEGKYDEAIAEFSRFVDRYPGGEEARAAVHLILDAYNLKEDYAGLMKYGQKILRSRKIQDAEFTNEIQKIVQAAEAKIISSFTVAALNDWDKKSDFSSGGGEGSAGRDASLGEYALYALLAPSREKKDLGTLFTSGSQLIEHYPGSPKVEEALSLMVDSSLRIGQFRLLAQYLEEYASRFPQKSGSLDFLYQAARIREGLGQYDLANKDYQDYQGLLDRDAGRTNDARTGSGQTRAQILLAMADNAGHKGDNPAALRLLQSSRDLLPPQDQIEVDARIADLYAKEGDFDKAVVFAARAKKAYNPKSAKAGGDLSGNLPSVMAGMEYDLLEQDFKKYMGIQLKGSIDNKLVAAKAKSLEALEKGYLAVIQYQSPERALAACYRSYETYREFARFLKESPLPELTPEEKEQYLQLIDQQAQGYTKKAEQYRSACVEKAHSWLVCDPHLARYFLDSSTRPEGSGFSRPASMAEITSQCFKDEALRELHQKLMENPDSLSTILTLCETYREKGDVRLSILIARQALDKAGSVGDGKGQSRSLKARNYNALGVSYLTIGEDRLAKDAFTAALAIDAQNIAARVNLAALYQYYGHIDQARSIYQSLPDQGKIEETKDAIHPKAREFYHAYLRG
ncbi:MAG: tetratricopeptide repeat protein [bacterium]